MLKVNFLLVGVIFFLKNLDRTSKGTIFVVLLIQNLEIMKTLKEYKLLFNDPNLIDDDSIGNTILGVQLQELFGEDKTVKADIHNLEGKIEVVCQMYKNGIDVFKDSYKLGSVCKAFYQWKLSHYIDY